MSKRPIKLVIDHWGGDVVSVWQEMDNISKPDGTRRYRVTVHIPDPEYGEEVPAEDVGEVFE